MAIESELQKTVTTMHHGKTHDFCIVDFSHDTSTPIEIKCKCRDFRDRLLVKFCSDLQNIENSRRQHYYHWTIQFLWGEIFNKIVEYNENTAKSVAKKHQTMFICFDDKISLAQQNSLMAKYNARIFFFEDDAGNEQSNCEAIFRDLENEYKERLRQSENPFPNYFYPIRLHANSISSGLVFNYFYSYLNRQVGSTNNIFIEFTFDQHIRKEEFPSSILIVLESWIETIYLENCPSTTPESSLLSLKSKTIVCALDASKFKTLDRNQTQVTYFVAGVGDYGISVEKLYIWQENLSLEALRCIELRDDIRQWRETYRPCPIDYPANGIPLATFLVEASLNEQYPRYCYLFSIETAPTTHDQHVEVSTMKKTTKDCFDAYRNYLEETNRGNDHENIEIRTVPTYYLIAPSSCNFDPLNTNNLVKCGGMTHLRGTIIDSDNSNNIHLATLHVDVLQSKPMLQYNRYLRRTFYYTDEIDENNRTIRYLFCAEYPFILSILDQMERCRLITSVQKREEYFRFCNMLNRIIAMENLSESIKVVQFDDENKQKYNEGDLDDTSQTTSYADTKLLSTMIKEDINKWYEKQDLSIAEPDIESMILPDETFKRKSLFVNKAIVNEPAISEFINDLKQKLTTHEYSIDDLNGNIDLIEEAQQIIFVYAGQINDNDNLQIVKALENKLRKFGVLRDVFIFINDGIKNFAGHLMQYIPYITFDLSSSNGRLTDEKLPEILNYLTNMNIMSKTYTEMFDDLSYFDQENALQCTSIGSGCAAAFYFNYAKILTQLPAHRYRMETLEQQIFIENRLDFEQSQSTFVEKWVFVIPWTIRNSSQLISYGLSLNEDEQKHIGFKLTTWKSAKSNFVVPELTLTIGGVFQRSYSPLCIYKLTNLTDNKSIYFPMEIPAALHGLQNQYENVRSRFNFGRFDPIEQAANFREKVEEYQNNEGDVPWHEHILLVPLDRPKESSQNEAMELPLHQANVLLTTLWRYLFPWSST